MRIIVLCLLLVSCLSPRKADRQLTKIANKYPEKISEICADSFNILEKHDTTTSVEYDWIELEPSSEVKYDTINDTILKRKYVSKERVIYKTITITNNVENTARVKELSDKLSKSDLLYKEADAKAKKYKGYSKILTFLFALLLIVLYFVFKRKK